MTKKQSKAARIRGYIEKNPETSSKGIAEALRVPVRDVYNVRYVLKKEAQPSTPSVARTVDTTNKITKKQAEAISEHISTIAAYELIKHYKLDFETGSALMYLCLGKPYAAKWFLDKIIERG